MLPSSVIDNLKCTVCRSSLSIFPIHTYGHKDTVTCGRCPVQQEFLPQREILYEEISQYIEFPCQYESRGCIDRLKPNAMQDHENNCLHKSYPCPVLPVCEFSWKGDYSELYEHYVTFHPALVFRNIEIDFNTSYEENYALFQEDETFIVQLKSDVKNGKFYCNVKSCGTDSTAKKIYYQTCFTNNKTTFSCEMRNVQYDTLENKLTSDTTSINITDIKSNLNNPTCVICTVAISVKPSNSTASSSSFIEDENEMLKTLECPVCFCYMIAPITQCNVGHSFCESHKPDLNSCPICKGTFGDIRNYLLEKITEIIAYPCKYNKNNCPFSSNANNIRDHEATCKYGPYNCIIDSCQWQNKFSDLKPHLRDAHKDALLEINSITYLLDPDVQTETDSYISFMSDHIFKLIFRRERNIFSWTLQLLGENYGNYMFELDFDSPTKEKVYLRKRCGPFVSDYATIKEEHTAVVHEETLANFIIDNILTYKVRIVEIN